MYNKIICKEDLFMIKEGKKWKSEDDEDKWNEKKDETICG